MGLTSEQINHFDELLSIYKEDKGQFIQDLIYPTMPVQSFHHEALRYKGIKVGDPDRPDVQKTFSGALLARGWWKTGVLTTGEILWEIVHDPNTVIHVIGEAETLAAKILGEVKQHLEGNKLLRYFYGDHVKVGKWSTGEITSSKRTEIIKEPTVEVFGVGGTITGRRCKIMYFDDTVTLKNSKTEYLRAGIYDWFRFVAEKILHPDGHLRIRGTRYYKRDLYFSLVKLYGKELFYRCPALAMDEEGVEYSNWEERFPTKSLQMERQRDPQAFALSMQNDVTDTDSTILNPGVLRYAGVNGHPAVPDFKDLQVIIGVDPARKVTGDGCYFTCVSVGRSFSSGLFFILRAIKRKLATPDAMVMLMAREYWYSKNKGASVRTIVVENNGFQDILKPHLASKQREIGVIPCKGMPTNVNKEAAFIAQAKYFNMDLVYVDTQCWELYEHLEAYPDIEFKDLIDGMLRAFEEFDRVYGGTAGVGLPVDPFALSERIGIAIGIE